MRGDGVEIVQLPTSCPLQGSKTYHMERNRDVRTCFNGAQLYDTLIPAARTEIGACTLYLQRPVFIHSLLTTVGVIYKQLIRLR